MTYIVEIAIIDQFHEEEHINVQLTLRILHDLSCSLVCAVKLFFCLFILFQLGSCSGQLQSGVEVFKVELEHKHSVAERVEFAQLFELLG